jgi:hypothetical protein
LPTPYVPAGASKLRYADDITRMAANGRRFAVNVSEAGGKWGFKLGEQARLPRLYQTSDDLLKGIGTKTGTVKYLGRMEDLRNIPRSQTILDEVPNLGSTKANYYQNMSVIRRNVREGVTFEDASSSRLKSDDAPLLPYWPSRTVGQSTYGAEKNLMINKGLWPKWTD